MEKYTDIHTLFVKYGVATREQVEEIIADAIAQIGKLAANETSGVSLKELSELSYETNHPVDKEGKTMGSCYLWVDNPEVYHILQGKDAKGRQRVEYKQTKVERKVSQAKTKSWADLQDDEDNDGKDFMIKTKTNLPSFVEWKTYVFTEKQKQEYHDRYYERYGKVINEDVLRISPAKVGVVDSKFVPHTLCVSGVPDGVTEAMVQRRFARYATVKRGNVAGGRVVQYPGVLIHNRNGKNTVYVSYSPTTRDASFALLMTKKFTMSMNGKPVVMYVSHSTQRF